MDSGIPKEAQIQYTKRSGIPALVRMGIHNTSSQNLYQPNSRVIIPIESGTPGCFLDPTGTRFEFDITIENSNPYVDFINLPRAGFGSIIREFTLEINGGPTESYRFYNDMCAIQLLKEGCYHEDWHHYVQNDWEPMDGMAGPFHVNFIKPCMISRSGYNMYDSMNTIGRGTKSLSSNIDEYGASTAPVLSTVRAVGLGGLFTGPMNTFHYNNGPEYATGARIFWPEINVDINTINTALDTGAPNAATVFTGLTVAVVGVVGTPSGGQIGALTSSAGIDTLNPSLQESTIRAGANTSVQGRPQIQTLLLGTDTINDFAFNISYVGSETPYGETDEQYQARALNRVGLLRHNAYVTPCPSRWPHIYNPYDYQKLAERNKIDKCRVIEEYERVTSYAGAQSLPVGFGAAYSPEEQARKQMTTYHVSIPFHSVTIGRHATRWFPLTLIPQGKMRVNLVLEEPRKAFRVSMDPCRIISGTLRTRGVNTGLLDAPQVVAAAAGAPPVGWHDQNIRPGGTLSKFSAVHSSMVMIPELEVYKCFNSACAMGMFTIPSLILSTASAPAFNVGRSLVGTAGAYSHINSGLSLNDVTLGTQRADQWSNVLRSRTWVQNATAGAANAGGVRNCYTNTCHPTPQYLPYKMKVNNLLVLHDPFLHGVSAENFCSETQVVYGTFLKRSRPQTRRCMAALLPLITNTPSVFAQEITYTIANCQIITREFLLPEASTISITETALSTGITTDVVLSKIIQQFLPQADTQKILVQGTSAFVNELSFFFRAKEQTQVVEAYGYDSFSFYNPFVKVSCQAIKNCDVGGLLRIQSPLNLGRNLGINVQLQIGGEFKPRIPINDIHFLLNETMLGDMEVYGLAHQKFMHSSSIGSDRTDGTYPSLDLLYDGFWAPFIPLQALDDQTCGANPYYIPYEHDLNYAPIVSAAAAGANPAVVGNVLAIPTLTDATSKRLRAFRPPTIPRAEANNTVVGVLPLFEPLKGTFHLSFNTRTFVCTDDLRTGTQIINNNVFLLMSKAYMCGAGVVELLTYIKAEGTLMFERGGNVNILG